MSVFDNSRQLRSILEQISNLPDRPDILPTCQLNITGRLLGGNACVWSSGAVRTTALQPGNTTNVVCGSLCCLLASDVYVEGLSLVQAFSDGSQTLCIYQVTAGAGEIVNVQAT